LTSPKKVQIANDIVFVIVFCAARTVLVDWLYVWTVYDDSPLFYKIQMVGLQVISMVWLWEILNKASKLAWEKNPDSLVVKSLYKFLRVNRKWLTWVWMAFSVVFSIRYLLDYHGVTKLPLYVFPKFPWVTYEQ
jgi:hypothetical protein